MRIRTTAGLIAVGIGIAAMGAGQTGAFAVTAKTTKAAAVKTDPNATFRFADTVPIVTLDPHKATGAGYNVWLFPVYDRLVHITPDGKAAPGLATEWTFSPDGLTMTMKLRKNVKFHDGKPFNAAAVVANIQRAKTLDKSAVKADMLIFSNVAAVDASTVAFTLTAPNTTAPLVLSERGGAIASPTAFDTLDLKPVGTGMYKVTAFVPSTSASFARNTTYWEPKAVGAAKMQFTTITDSLQRSNALVTGQVDATLLDAPQVASVKGQGFTVVSSKNYQFFHLQLNRARGSFGDVRVRQALNYAIDRQALVDGLLFGLGEPAVQPFAEGTAGFNTKVGNLYYRYDKATAKGLLKDAGAENLKFQIVTLNIPAYVKLAEAVQGQLSEIGVNVEIVQVTNVSQAFYVDQSGDSTVINWTGRTDPLITAQQLFSGTGFSNPGRHTTPAVADLQAKALVETDPVKREQILSDLGGQITKDALDVVLYFPTANLASSNKVVGFQNWVSGKLEFRGVAMKK